MYTGSFAFISYSADIVEETSYVLILILGANDNGTLEFNFRMKESAPPSSVRLLCLALSYWRLRLRYSPTQRTLSPEDVSSDLKQTTGDAVSTDMRFDCATRACPLTSR